MENLNAEQIIKALEWCSSGGNCINCHENDKNPRLSKEGCMALQMRYALSLIKELTEENERLRAIPKQMKERLQAYLVTYVLGYKIPLSEVLKGVDQIAKEMSEGV